MFAIIGVIISVSLAPGPGMIQGWLKRWKCFLSKCGMSFLMLFKGELVTDPGRGLLCVIMGSGQGTPVPQSSTPSLFSWRLGRGVRRGECPNVHRGTGTGIQRTEDTKTREPAELSLPTCRNPVLEHFLPQPAPSQTHCSHTSQQGHPLTCLSWVLPRLSRLF